VKIPARKIKRPFAQGRQALMSRSAPRRPRQGSGRWDVIQTALESWSRTLRLCLILLVTIAAPIAAAAAGTEIGIFTDGVSRLVESYGYEWEHVFSIRESWRARLRQYQAARHVPLNERDGWYSLDDPDEYDFAACRWPVLRDDVVRGPPVAALRVSA
jgi:hypothetical protein